MPVLQRDWFGDGLCKEICLQCGRPASIPVLGRSSEEGNDSPLQYSCWENPIDGNLAGYSPGGCKEVDMIESLTHTRFA